jgi:protein gp37
MGEDTAIGWCDHTLNPIIGCEEISPGCAHCYAKVSTPARVRRAKGTETWGPSGTRSETKDWEAAARKWHMAAVGASRRRRVFCASLSDVLEDRPEWVPVRVRLVRLIAATPWLDWLLLTKRPENAVRLVRDACRETNGWTNTRISIIGGVFARTPCVCGAHGPESTGAWASNIWIGTTVEDQVRADERIPRLLEVPAAVRFLSVEPQLAPISFEGPRLEWLAPFRDTDAMLRRTPRVDWIIQGGESGPKARPFDVAWARALRDTCAQAGTAYFLKQLGSHVLWNGCAAPGEAWPAGTRTRDNAILTEGRSGGWRVLLGDRLHGARESEWPDDLCGRRAFPR